MTQWGLDTLFNPAKRHMDEEKQRLQSTREEVGDSSGGRRIDLESGKVTISRGGKAKVDPDEDAAEAADEQAADNGDVDAPTASADTEGGSADDETAESDQTG